MPASILHPDASLAVDAVCPVEWQHPLNKGLALWLLSVPGWGGGRTWADLCRRSAGTLTNMAFPGSATSGWGPTTRRGGYGELRFDGTNDGVAMASNINAVDNTVSLWLRASSAPAAEQELIGAFNNAGPYPFALRLQTNGSVRYIVYDGTSFPLVDSSVSVADGAWHHVCGVRDTAADRLYVYVDGVQRGSATDTTTGSTSNSAALTVGYRNNNQLYFAGALDDVRVYASALPAAEVMALSLEPRNGYPGLRRVSATAYFLGGLGAASGELAGTLGDLTCAAAGAALVAGTCSATLDAASLSASASAPASALLARTLGTLACTAAATVLVSGGADASLGALALSAAGTSSVSGALAATLAAVTLASAGAGPAASPPVTGADLDFAHVRAAALDFAHVREAELEV